MNRIERIVAMCTVVGVVSCDGGAPAKTAEVTSASSAEASDPSDDYEDHDAVSNPPFGLEDWNDGDEGETPVEGEGSCTIYYDEFDILVMVKDFSDIGEPVELEELTLLGDEGQPLQTFHDFADPEAVAEHALFFTTLGEEGWQAVEHILESNAFKAKVVAGDRFLRCDIEHANQLFDGYGSCPHCIVTYVCACLAQTYNHASANPICEGYSMEADDQQCFPEGL
ncbi:MAG: hypothetical protein RMA76_37605 [Deltaproteobacteria bacterium]|jgi:hypothetical protein